MKRLVRAVFLLVAAVLLAGTASAQKVVLKEYSLPDASHPHDVAPAADGGIWYTPQYTGGLGWLDPATGKTRTVDFGAGSRPHGVIVGSDGAAWVTDGGLNAIVRVDPATLGVTRFPLPDDARGADLNTAAFDGNGVLWFTGQAGWLGRLDPRTRKVGVFRAPRGRGPYGIHALARGPVYFVSLAAGFLGRIDPVSSGVTVIDLPAKNEGPRRVWLDSKGRPWVSGWYSGTLLSFDPSSSTWTELRLPGSRPAALRGLRRRAGPCLDERLGLQFHRPVRPGDESLQRVSHPDGPDAEVRQLLGRPGEVWGAESGRQAARDPPRGGPSMKPATVFLSEMTNRELELFLEKAATVLVPTGSTEQHGPHSALGTDVIIPEELCRRAAPRIPAVVGPSLPYGLS